MRKRISLQLIAGFAGIVTVAVLVIGLIFIGLYQRAAMDTKRDDMLLRGRNLAPLLTGYMDGSGSWRGLGGLFRMMEAVNDVQLWVLDANGAVVSLPGMGMGMPGGDASHSSGTLRMNESLWNAVAADGAGALPETAGNTVLQVLSGEETADETFSPVYGQAMLTVGVPILSEEGVILGGVLLHAPVDAISQGLSRAYALLAVGLFAGFAAAIGLGIIFSMRFTHPLRRMNRIAHAMAEGDYKVRTALTRQDEFGQLADALDHLAVSLGLAAEEGDRLEKMRRDFIANVSHEFRTPLTVIRGSAEALMDGTAADGEERAHRLQAILSETAGMNRLVGDLLDLSRLESGRIDLHPEPVWLQELLDDLWRGLAPIAAKVPLTLERRLPDGLPPLFADYGRLRQLLLIFLDNAVKHSFPHGRILVTASAGESAVEIRIQDNGSGIPAEDLPHVWERFYTTDTSRNRQGTGLGLPIARQLASRMQGTVELQRVAPAEDVTTGTLAILCLPSAQVPMGG